MKDNLKTVIFGIDLFLFFLIVDFFLMVFKLDGSGPMVGFTGLILTHNVGIDYFSTSLKFENNIILTIIISIAIAFIYKMFKERTHIFR